MLLVYELIPMTNYILTVWGHPPMKNILYQNDLYLINLVSVASDDQLFYSQTSVFLLSSLVDPVLSRLYKSVLLKESTQCLDESRTSDPRSPLSKWKIKKILIKCRTDWKNYRFTQSGYNPTCRSSRPYCGNIFFLMLIV